MYIYWFSSHRTCTTVQPLGRHIANNHKCQVKIKRIIAVCSQPHHCRNSVYTCHMGSNSATCHPAEVTIPPLYPSQLKLIATPRECKAELPNWFGYIPRWYTRQKTVTHPSTNLAQCRVPNSFLRRTTLPQRQTGQSLVRFVRLFLRTNPRQTYNILTDSQQVHEKFVQQQQNESTEFEHL